MGLIDTYAGLILSGVTGAMTLIILYLVFEKQIVQGAAVDLIKS